MPKGLRWAWPGLLVLMALACGNLPWSGQANRAPTAADGIQVHVPLNQVFYGASTCGPTALAVNIQVDDPTTAGQVGVQYRLVGAQPGPWQQASATATGAGHYQALVPLDTEAEGFFQGQAGRIEFRAYVSRGQGELVTSPAEGVLQVPVQPCRQQPVGTAQDQTPPRVVNLFTSAAPVYYSGTCTPGTLTVTAVVVDDSGQAQVQLEYWFQRNGQPVGQSRTLPMQGQGTLFRATIPVAQEAASALQGQEGQLGFRVVASDAAGHRTEYPAPGVQAQVVAVQPCAAAAAGASSAPGGAAPPSSSGGAAVPPPPPSGGSSGPSGGQGPGGAPGSSGAASLSIQVVQAYPDMAYYGPCINGETTWVEIEVVVDDIQRVASAQVRYHYESSSAPANDFSRSAAMYREQGIGNYMARIEVGQELPADATVDRLAYYVEITTTDGQTLTSAAQRHPLARCASGGSPGGATPPQVQSVVARPDPVYAGMACGGPDQPTLLEVEADIVPASAVQQAWVILGYVPAPNTAPQYVGEVPLTYVNGDTFAAGIDLNTWYGNASPAEGQLALTVAVESEAGTDQSNPIYVTLRPCTNPTPTIVTFAVWPSVVMEGEIYALEWEVQDATCGVFLDGQPVDANGTVTLTAPAVDADQTFFHTLEAHGGACDSPTVVTQDVSVTVQAQAAAFWYDTDVILYPDQTYDLNQDGWPDFRLVVDAGMFVVHENGADFITLEPSAVTGANADDLEECRARFLYGEPVVQNVNVTHGPSQVPLLCVRTGTGQIGFIRLLDALYDDGVPTGYLEFTAYSEIP